MTKTKLRWEYPPQSEMHTVEVNDIHNIGLNGFTHLRPCQYGINEQGEIKKILYCTRDGHFFRRAKDGWHELKPYVNQNQLSYKRPSGWIGSWHPDMSNHGHRHCHLLVAHAWISPRPDGKECDHLNGNLLDWTADNLRWITPNQNRDWANRQRAMRKIGFDLRHIYYHNLRGISSLTDEQFEYWLTHVQELFAASKSELTIESINLAVAEALDDVHDLTITCSRCGKKMIVDTEESYTRHGILCDDCYGDLFG